MMRLREEIKPPDTIHFIILPPLVLQDIPNISRLGMYVATHIHGSLGLEI